MATKGAKTRERILAEAEKLIYARGYTGTSVDDIIAATGLTKGAFFYHFKSKSELALALIRRFWERDVVVFREMTEQARSLGDDPLQTALIFFKLFEEAIRNNPEQPLKCLFASYLYEGEQFDENIHGYIRKSLDEWKAIFLGILEPIFSKSKPKLDVTADELAEMIMELIEGSFVIAQATNDRTALARASAQFRRHLQLLFQEQ